MAATTFHGIVTGLRTVSGGVRVTLGEVGPGNTPDGSGDWSYVASAHPALGAEVTVTIGGEGSPTFSATVTAVETNANALADALITTDAGPMFYRCALGDVPALGASVPVTVA